MYGKEATHSIPSHCIQRNGYIMQKIFTSFSELRGATLKNIISLLIKKNGKEISWLREGISFNIASFPTQLLKSLSNA